MNLEYESEAPPRKQAPKVSVVIPSLGGKSLEETISCIYQSTFSVHEIIVVLPTDHEFLARSQFSDKLKVLHAGRKGQVYQRSIGFEAASGELVLQLDDDFKFDSDVLDVLVQTLLALGPGHVISPLYRDSLTGIFSESDHRLIGGLRSVYLSLLGGLPRGKEKFGAFSPLTCSLGVCLKYLDSPLHKVGWLPGGFVFQYSCDLIHGNFYPFQGKAYGEDLLHSELRRVRGLRQFIVSEVFVYTRLAHQGVPSRRENSRVALLLSGLHVLHRRWEIANLLHARKSSMYLYFSVELLGLLIRTVRA